MAAAELSDRYITDRFLPDKAIDLIDEAAAKIKIEMDSKPEVMDRLDRRLIQLQIEREAVRREKDEASQKRFGLIEDEIAKLQKEIADLDEIWQAEKAAGPGQRARHAKRSTRSSSRSRSCKRKGDFNKVAELQYGKLPGAREAPEGSRRPARPNKGKSSAPTLLRTQVGAEEIAEVVARATGIPVAKLMQGERDKLLHDGRQAARARGRPGRGHRRGRQRDPPLALGPVGPEPPDRLVPVPRPHGRGQDRAVQGAGGLPVRQRRPPDPHRHERVHGEAFGRAA